MLDMAPLSLHDFSPETETFLHEALQGLKQTPKTLPCKYFYDERGSRLFDEICDLEEYYLTRTETAIMMAHGYAMADALGPDCLLVEYGSGSSRKTRMLLNRMNRLAGYVPIDISREHLLNTANKLSAAYPDLEILPVCADYTEDFSLPHPSRKPRSAAVYFPGSTIGNFEPDDAIAFLSQIARVCGRSGQLLIGVDLKKDLAILEPAYNDRKGVTAEFNLNLLRRMNRELDADFRVDRFRHQAVYNDLGGRIEMHLISLGDQVVHLGGEEISFRECERIVTEYSCKYSLPEFAALAKEAGFVVDQVWTDPQNLFSVQLLRVE